MVRTVSATLLLACIGACSQVASGNAAPETVEPDPSHIALAETLVPSDPDLSAIYERSCRTCHALDGLGAPLTGHSAAWAPRFDERGMEGVIASVRKGRGAMPAMGYCPDCTDDNFRALIEFMATEGQP